MGVGLLYGQAIPLAGGELTKHKYGGRTSLTEVGQGGSEHNLPNVRLQWEMLYDTLNMKDSGTVVRGDGAGWGYRKGFVPTLQSMKKHN